MWEGRDHIGDEEVCCRLAARTAASCVEAGEVDSGFGIATVVGYEVVAVVGLSR